MDTGLLLGTRDRCRRRRARRLDARVARLRGRATSRPPGRGRLLEAERHGAQAAGRRRPAGRPVPGAGRRRAGDEHRPVPRARAPAVRRRPPDAGRRAGPARAGRARDGRAAVPHARPGARRAVDGRAGAGRRAGRARRAGARDARRPPSTCATRRRSWSPRCARRRCAGSGASCSSGGWSRPRACSRTSTSSSRTQVRTDDGLLRPDMVIKLAGGKNVVVDAKVAFLGFLDAAQADRRARPHRAARRARAARPGARRRPGGQAVLGPVRAGAGVRRDVRARRVVPARGRRAGPAADRVRVRAQRRHRDAHHPARPAADRRPTPGGRTRWPATRRPVLSLGKELHGRLATMGSHLAKLGRAIDSAAGAYNQTVSSLETRVLVSARRFADLHVVDADLPTPDPVNPQLSRGQRARAGGVRGGADRHVRRPRRPRRARAACGGDADAGRVDRRRAGDAAADHVLASGCADRPASTPDGRPDGGSARRQAGWTSRERRPSRRGVTGALPAALRSARSSRGSENMRSSVAVRTSSTSPKPCSASSDEDVADQDLGHRGAGRDADGRDARRATRGRSRTAWSTR